VRILNDLIVTGLVKSDGLLFVPEFTTEQAVSTSWASRSFSSASNGAIYTDQNGVPQFVETSSFGSGSGKTPIACEPTNSVETSGSMGSYYKCLVSGSRNSTLSNFALSGNGVDKGGIYSGSARANYSTQESGSVNPNRITHVSKIVLSGSASGSYTNDFIMDLIPGHSYHKTEPTSKLTVYTDACDNATSGSAAFEAIAQRFKALMCHCLKNGQFMSFNVTIICRTTGATVDRGRIDFKKCFGKCTHTATRMVTTGFGMTPPLIDNNGKSFSESGHEIPWTETAFNYAIKFTTGSSSVESGSGALSASFTPYMAVPSAPTTADTYYPFSGALTGSNIQTVPGLIYFDTLNSTLNLYNGSGSWSSFRNTQQQLGTIVQHHLLLHIIKVHVTLL
jgi:hypothetical protein